MHPATDDEDDGLFAPLDDIDLPDLPAAPRLVVNAPPADQKRPLPLVRPTKRSECANVPRPCPFVSCRFHLYLDVRNDGVLRLNFPDREPHEMAVSCSLDLATDGPRTLDFIAGLMGVSKERARQLEASGLAKVRGRFHPEDV